VRRQLSTLLVSISVVALVPLLVACGAGQTPQTINPQTPQDIQKAAQDYFSGKTVTIEVGYAPGGGQDTNARLTAKYLGKHIPGTPQIVVENRTGSDGLIAAQYTMQQPADGMSMVLVNNILPQKAALGGEPLPGFDVFHSAVLGNMQVPNRPYDNYMVCVRSDVASTYQQALAQVKQQGRPLTAGVFRGGSWGAVLPTYFDMPFKPVAGYTGTDTILQAMDQNELEVLVDGCNYEQIDRLHPDWLKKPSRVTPILNTDGSDLTPLKSAFDTAGWQIPPRIDEALNLTDAQKQLLKAGQDASTITTHEWMVRGDTPAWILQVERDALKGVTEDSAFVADMDKINRKAGYVTPQQYDEYYKSLQSYTGELKEAMKIFAGLTGQ
jgi:hypothetical protein